MIQIYYFYLQSKDRQCKFLNYILWFLSWFEIFITIPKKYVILFLWIIVLVSSWPIVAYCISKYLSIATERATCYGLFHSFGSFKLCPCILVLINNVSIMRICSKSSRYYLQFCILQIVIQCSLCIPCPRMKIFHQNRLSLGFHELDEMQYHLLRKYLEIHWLHHLTDGI